MELQLGELEKYWDKYTAWCKSNGLYPEFSDYLIWLDDQDIDVGQEWAEYESI